MKAIGTILAVLIAIAVALFGGAYIGMLVIGAYATHVAWIAAGPGFWETFFGLWSLAILGSTVNSWSFRR